MEDFFNSLLDEDNRIVTLSGPPGVNMFYTKSGEVIAMGADGLFRVPARDAQFLRENNGWKRIEKPE